MMDLCPSVLIFQAERNRQRKIRSGSKAKALHQGLPRSPNAHDRLIERSAFALREVLRFREAGKGTLVYEVSAASQSVIATSFFASLFGCRVAGLAIKRGALQRSASRMAPGFSGIH
jgi:hypothetical protein